VWDEEDRRHPQPNIRKPLSPPGLKGEKEEIELQVDHSWFKNLKCSKIQNF
jgi:hypothetical protein